MTARGLIDLLKRVDPDSTVAYEAFGEVYQLKSAELTATGLLLELEPYPFDPTGAALDAAQQEAAAKRRARRRYKGKVIVKDVPASPADTEEPA